MIKRKYLKEHNELIESLKDHSRTTFVIEITPQKSPGRMFHFWTILPNSWCAALSNNFKHLDFPTVEM